MQSVLRGLVQPGQPGHGAEEVREPTPASRGVAQGRWPWGKSQEVKGGNTLA